MSTQNNDRKDQKRIDPITPQGLGATSGHSEKHGIEVSHSIVTDDCEWPSDNEAGNHDGTERVIGGILGHLRFVQQAYLNYVDAHAERLEARLRENHAHKNEVLSKMQGLEDAVARLLSSQEQQDD